MRRFGPALVLITMLFGAQGCGSTGSSGSPRPIPSPSATAVPSNGTALTYVYARGAVDVFVSGVYGARPTGQILSDDLANGSNAHQALATDRLGTLYASVLAADGRTYVDAFSGGATGQTLPVARLPFGALSGFQPQIAVDGANALYVLAGGTIQVYSRVGGAGTAQQTAALTLHKPAHSLAVGGDGKVYVAGTEDCRSGPARSYVDVFAPVAQGAALVGEIEGPATGINTTSVNGCATLDALAVDQSATVYVTLTDIASNPNDGAVVSFATGQYGNVAGTVLHVPGLKAKELAVDASGRLLVGGSQAGGEVNLFSGGTGVGVYGDRTDPTAIVAPIWGVAAAR